jgi:ATP-binding cassette subfamily B (MDR/TAP) protein 1
MGDGQVIEQGTHAQLLANPEGPYARLVQAQKLREAERRGEDFESSSEDEETAAKKQAGAMGVAAEQEDPLQRSNTSRSLASEILEQKRRERGSLKERTYGTWDMFRRMGTINKEAVPYYIVGFIGAICTGMVYPAFGIVFAEAIQGFQLSGHDLRVASESII